MQNRLYSLLVLFASLLCMSLTSYALTVNQTIHTFLLGSQDLSPESESLVRTALQTAGFENAQRLPVKALSSVGAMLVDTALCFNSDCVWVNEAKVKDLSDDQKSIAYHVAMVECKIYNPNKYLLSNIVVPSGIGSIAYLAYSKGLPLYFVLGAAGLSIGIFSAITSFC